MRADRGRRPAVRWAAGLPALLIVAGILGTAVSAAAAEELRLPDYRTVTLENGLGLRVVRQATVPLVTFEVWIRAGATADPPGKEGLAELTAESLRKGSGDLDAAGFAAAVDFLGADFETSVNHDRTRVRLSLLAKDFDRGLELLSGALLHPAFDAGEVGKLAAQLADGVAQAKDNPRYVLGDYFDAALYGGHPYGNPVGGTETSLPALGPDDVRGFYRDLYGADRTLITVCGDVDPAAAEAAVRRTFAEMPRAAAPVPVVPAPESPAASRVFLVNKPDTPQTWFQIGALGPAYDDPDYAAAELVWTIFGGRFTSWLNTKLRIESGLTYGARYRFDRRAQAGPAFMMSFTATEHTKEALDLALAQLDRLHEEGIGEEDLASAKAYLKGQTPYDYETASSVAYAVSELAFYGVDRSRVDDLFQRLDAVTSEDCRRVIDTYMQRDHLVLTAVGVKDSIAPVLGTYGELKVLENSDPGFR
jgi:zinc protease